MTTGDSRVLAAPAKVNLTLRVLEREPSGYHALQTLFCRLALADQVEVALEDEPGVRLRVEGAEDQPPPNLGPPAENLVVRAAGAFLEAAGIEQGLRIRLQKRIPHGGGLGGGSSDAASTLLALDSLLPGLVSPERMEGVAATLGSDVPFFLSGAPLAWAQGRGERLTPLPALPPRPVVLAVPPFRVATPAAYGWLDRDRTGREVPSPLTGPPADWAALEDGAVNDFERSVYRRHPELRALRDRLRRSDALVALLSGSGST
ncbi:MAG TPA: 4-(cytidine 5'-diphospho)-2-C-methyl-D-erythritol kinase, partial [Longimicrobiales bacterium]|nr:4-(cytidine 5'-diphospho)-2-C-methyl-D-erythritol kinase [Longimicrobiales bacterium]